jgi:hypothetical protein
MAGRPDLLCAVFEGALEYARFTCLYTQTPQELWVPF